MINKLFRRIFVGLTTVMLMSLLTVGAAFAQDPEIEVDVAVVVQTPVLTNVGVATQAGVAVTGPTIAVFGEAIGGDANVVQEARVEQTNQAIQFATQVRDSVIGEVGP